MNPPRNSLVVPVYGNSRSIKPLVSTVESIEGALEGGLETIFVIDGSPDDSREKLVALLADRKLDAQIIDHARNFGSFAAIRTGLRHARGRFIAVMAADLQEPPELVVEFLRRLATGEVDVVAGERASRDDRGDAASKLYWSLYGRFIMSDIPPGGVDVFACTVPVRDVLCSLESVHTSLVAQLFWVGFRRELVPYNRLPSPGPSGWTFRRKLRYLSDSVFAFTDLPVRVLWLVGLLGLVLGGILAAAVVVAKISGTISVPGYAATVLLIVFFGSLNMVGLGIIGSYVWRAYETVKGRPGAIVRDVTRFSPGDPDE